MLVIRENDDIPVRPHTSLEQYCCSRNSDSYFVNIRFVWAAISFVDLHTAAYSRTSTVVRAIFAKMFYTNEYTHSCITYTTVYNVYQLQLPKWGTIRHSSKTNQSGFFIWTELNGPTSTTQQGYGILRPRAFPRASQRWNIRENYFHPRTIRRATYSIEVPVYV
jgi:hypothetical protein